jgi:hypothetical protein
VLAECVPAELPTALAAVQPRTLVLDPDGTLPPDILPRMDELMRVVTRVPGASAPAVAASWRVRLSGEDRERFAAHTLGWPMFLIVAPAPAAGADVIPFEVWQLSPGALASMAPLAPTPPRSVDHPGSDSAEAA